MIELKDISKSYSKNRALDKISLSIPEGLVTGIIGPNGAGKSTLIKILAGFEFPDEGEVRIFKKRVQNFDQRKQYLSYMPETMQIYPEYFVDEFLDFYHGAVSLRDDGLIAALSLKKVYKKKIGFLSKGWHQRLKLYITLCNTKPVAILDEPFDGFDPLQLKEIINIFRTRRSEGRSFILSIHQLNDAQKICDYFILLDEGRKIGEGTLKDLGERFLCNSGSLEDIFLKALER